MCRGQPLDSYIKQFSISFDIDSSEYNTDTYEIPAFTIYLTTAADFAVITPINVNNFDSKFEQLFYLPKHTLSTFMVDMFQTS